MRNQRNAKTRQEKTMQGQWVLLDLIPAVIGKRQAPPRTSRQFSAGPHKDKQPLTSHACFWTLVACKKAITRKYYKPDPPTHDNWQKVVA